MEQNIEKNKNATRNLETRKLAIKEGFDGIRKSNSRIIFTILLSIIILDFVYECART